MDANDALMLVKGSQPSGKKIYAYILMDKKAFAQLKHDINNQVQTDFKKYGKVIAFGFGEPNMLLQKKMKTFPSRYTDIIQ